MKRNETSARASVKVTITNSCKDVIVTALYQLDTKKAIKRIEHLMASMSKR